MFKPCKRRADRQQSVEIDARQPGVSHILITILPWLRVVLLTRKSFNAAAPEITCQRRVMTRTDIGLLATLFYITYGLSVLLRHRQRPLQCPLLYGLWANRNWSGEYSVWLFPPRSGRLPCCGR